VAAAAGVSPTTVSHALNGLGRLSEQTRNHVLEVATRLGYRANPSARNMRSSSSGIIAVINQLSEDAAWGAADLEYIMRLNQAVCAAAWASDSYPTLLPAGADARTLARMPLDGAILVDPLLGDPTLEGLDSLKIPTVTVGRDDRGQPGRAWWVDNDIRSSTLDALEHLARGGAERIMLLAADTGQSYMSDAVDSYVEWCERQGRRRRLVQLSAPFQADECFRAVSRACSARWPIDALYIVAEAFVRPSVDAVFAAGRSIPGGVQVAVASDSAVARSTRPALTALDLDPESIGATAVDLLLQRRSGAVGPQTVTVAATLVIRESTLESPTRLALPR